MEFAGALVGPERLEGKGQEDGRAGHVRHDPREGLGRLAHRPGDVRGEAQVEDYEDNQEADENLLLRITHPHVSDIVAKDAGRSSSSFQLVGERFAFGKGWREDSQTTENDSKRKE